MSNELQKVDAKESQTIEAGKAIFAKAEKFEVEDAEKYRIACETEVEIKRLLKDAESYFKPIVDQAKESARAIIEVAQSQWDRATEWHGKAMAILQKKRLAYEETARELARKKQEEERLRVEQQAKAEAEELAQIFEQVGEEELADEARKNVIINTPKTIAPDIPKVKGIGSRTHITFEIVNQSKIDRKYMVPDMTAIGKLVRAMGADAENVIGKGSIRVNEGKIPTTRTR